MKPNQPTIISAQPSIEAYCAAALDWLGWLLGLILTLGAPRRSRRLVRFVQLCERGVEAIVFLKAIARLGLLRRRRRGLPPNAPPGFRRAVVKPRRRLLYKSARIRLRCASLRQRVARLISVLANPELYVARFIARLRRRLRATVLLLIAPPAQACAFGAPRAPVAIDDS